MKKELEIIINADGTTSIDAINFDGQSCEAVIREFADRLGNTKVIRKKPEFYQQKQKGKQKNKQRE